MRAIPYFYGENHALFFCSVCPAGAIAAAVPNAVRLADCRSADPMAGLLKIVILVVFLAAMLFTYRPWCTMFCPLGASYGLFNYVSGAGGAVPGRRVQRLRPVPAAGCSHHGPRRAAGRPAALHPLPGGCLGCGALTIGTVFNHDNSARPGSRIVMPAVRKWAVENSLGGE